jgi:hypothetical protein
MFGSGCWAERSVGGRSVACSVSGQGELIVQSLLAKSLAERAAASTEGDTHEILRSVLVDQFYGASLLSSIKMSAYKMHLPTRPSFWLRNVGRWSQRGEHQPAVGVLLLTQGMDGDEGTGP